MTTAKMSRSGFSHSLVQVGLGTISLGLLCAFGVSVQQPPQEPVPKMQQENAQVPALAPPPIAPAENFKNDPLFLEIQKIVRAGSTPSAASGPSNNRTTESLSNSRWHAVESILAAARMLEHDVAECASLGDVEGAAKLQRAIRTLRAQALDLLH